jgi:hypothetical protein
MTLVRKAGTSCLLIMGLLGCDVATKNTSASNVEAETNSMERSQHINAVETLMAR